MKVPKHLQSVGHDFSQASARAKATVVKWKNHMIEWIRSYNPMAAKTQAHKGVISQHLEKPGVPLSLKTKNVTAVPKLVDTQFRTQVTAEMAKQFHDHDLQGVLAIDRAENSEFSDFLIDLGLLEQAKANPEDIGSIREREDAVFESFKKLVEIDERVLEKEISFSLPLVKAFAAACFTESKKHDSHARTAEAPVVLYEKTAFADRSNRRELIIEMYRCIEGRREILEEEAKKNKDLASLVSHFDRMAAFPQGQRDTDEFRAAEDAVFADIKKILEAPRKEMEEKIPTALLVVQAFGRICFTEDKPTPVAAARTTTTDETAASPKKKITQTRSPAEINATARRLLKENVSPKVDKTRQMLKNRPAVDAKAIPDGGKAGLLVKIPVKIITFLALSILRPRTELLNRAEERRSIENSIHSVPGELQQLEMIQKQAQQVSRALAEAPKTQQQKVQELLARRKGPASPTLGGESADLAEMGSVGTSPASSTRSISPVPEASEDPLAGVSPDKRVIILRKQKAEEKNALFLSMQIALCKVSDDEASDRFAVARNNPKFAELVQALNEMDQDPVGHTKEKLQHSVLGKMEEIYREGNLRRNLGDAHEDFIHHFDTFFEVKAPAEKGSSWIGKLHTREKPLTPAEKVKLQGQDKLRRARNWFKGVKE